MRSNFSSPLTINVIININPAKLIVLISLILGIFFRFYNLEQKFYWFDEAFTSLRVSGFTELELVRGVSQNQLINVSTLLQEYQSPNPKKNVTDTVKSLALEEPQHPPFYFIIARFWLQCFGSSIKAIRSLSVVSSLLTLPCIYCLCLELFRFASVQSIPVQFVSIKSIPVQSEQIGLIAVGLTAISPFQILYAQEAREYSLWIVTILLSNIVFLRAIRLKKKRIWGLYTASIVFGLYTFPNTFMVAIAHGIYIIALEGLRLSRTVKFYLASSLVEVLLFLPWLIVLFINLAQVNKTFVRGDRVSVLMLLGGWFANLDRLFIDLSDYEREIKYFGFKNLFAYSLQFILAVLITVLVGYSFCFLCRKTPKQVWLFVLIEVGVTVLPVMLVNLFFGGKQSLVLRYFMPACLGIELAVACLLASQFSGGSTPAFQRMGRAILATLIASGVASCIASSQAHFWWTKSHSDMNYQVAPVINESDRPLIISDAPMGRILAFSHLLNDKVQLQLQPSCFSCPVNSRAIDSTKDIAEIPSGFSDVFLYNPSQLLLNKFEKEDFKIISLYSDPVHTEQKILRLQH